MKCRNRRIQVVSQSISQFRRNPPRAHRACSCEVRLSVCPVCVPALPPVASVFLHVHDLTSRRAAAVPLDLRAGTY